MLIVMQVVRGGLTLPHGTGQSSVVCVIAKGSEAQAAKDAGETPPCPLSTTASSMDHLLWACSYRHERVAYLSSLFTGADVVGDEALIESILASNGKAISFDKLICTPEMSKVSCCIHLFHGNNLLPLMILMFPDRHLQGLGRFLDPR